MPAKPAIPVPIINKVLGSGTVGPEVMTRLTSTGSSRLNHPVPPPPAIAVRKLIVPLEPSKLMFVAVTPWGK